MSRRPYSRAAASASDIERVDQLLDYLRALRRHDHRASRTPEDILVAGVLVFTSHYPLRARLRLAWRLSRALRGRVRA